MLLNIDRDNPERDKIKEVVKCLRHGGIVIYPTDTLYSFGCDIHNPVSMEKICKIKGLDYHHAHISMILGNLKEACEYVSGFSTTLYKRMNKTLPGPYTYILKANKCIPKVFQFDKTTIGIRIPNSKIVSNILKYLDKPITSTSVYDISTNEFMNNPAEIHERYKDQVDIVLDAGICELTPSSIIDFTGKDPVMIRRGKGVELLDEQLF